MKFLITCDHCGSQFLTEGESKQTVQCQCPHCGGQMKVKLPLVEETATELQPEQVQTHRLEDVTEEPHRRTGCGIAVGIFIGLFLLVLVAMVVYSMTHTEHAKPIEDPFENVYPDSTDYVDTLNNEEPDENISADTVQQHIEEPTVDLEQQRRDSIAEAEKRAAEASAVQEEDNNPASSSPSTTPSNGASTPSAPSTESSKSTN